MTDRELLVQWLTQTGVPYSEDRNHAIVLTVPYDDRDTKVRGYTDFMTEFHFHPDGSLDHVQMWE